MLLRQQSLRCQFTAELTELSELMMLAMINKIQCYGSLLEENKKQMIEGKCLKRERNGKGQRAV